MWHSLMYVLSFPPSAGRQQSWWPSLAVKTERSSRVSFKRRQATHGRHDRLHYTPYSQQNSDELQEFVWGKSDTIPVNLSGEKPLKLARTFSVRNKREIKKERQTDLSCKILIRLSNCCCQTKSSQCQRYLTTYTRLVSSLVWYISMFKTKLHMSWKCYILCMENKKSKFTSKKQFCF